MSNKLEAFFKSFADSEEQLDFKMAHETVGKKVPTVSTGSFALDDALSCGGLPCGRIIQYYGPPASGKTLMTMLSLKEAQELDPEAQQVFIDAEQTFSAQWAEQLGLDTSRIIHIEGDTASNGRRCFEMLLGVPKEDKSSHILKGKSKDGLLDKIINKEFNINMIVLDSLGQIIPPGEDVSSIGKMNMALLSRFLTPTFRKLSLEVSKAKIPFIVINHKRDNMSMYGPDHTFSGGNSYAHSLSANVYFEAVQSKDSSILDENERKIGHTIRATVEKSKFGPHPRKCEFKVNFGIGIVDKHIEIADLALQYGIIQKPSSVTHQYGEMKWVGAPKFYEAVRDDVNLYNELVVKVKDAREALLDTKRQEQEEVKAKLADEVVSEADSEESKAKRGRKAKA